VPDVIAVFGGVYANHLALRAVLEDAERRGATRFYCLGDLGGFGPNPDRVFPILFEAGVTVVQGNYDESVGNRLGDCGCGYTDPRDNHYARIAYAYTLARTSDRHKDWLRTLPRLALVELGGKVLRMVHGSPRRVNEFLWESASPDDFLERLLADHPCDALLCTHTGIPWQRRLPSGKQVVNAGAVGRPANDGRTEVWYALVSAAAGELWAELVPVAYDHERLAREMESEGLPPEFVETIRTGWWTTCLEILPAKERLRGRF
jgi:diadenosine tetraphosphatase ApaH/serine/threonine PP2A family protein phosphatase